MHVNGRAQNKPLISLALTGVFAFDVTAACEISPKRWIGSDRQRWIIARDVPRAVNRKCQGALADAHRARETSYKRRFAQPDFPNHVCLATNAHLRVDLFRVTARSSFTKVHRSRGFAKGHTGTHQICELCLARRQVEKTGERVRPITGWFRRNPTERHETRSQYMRAPLFGYGNQERMRAGHARDHDNARRRHCIIAESFRRVCQRLSRRRTAKQRSTKNSETAGSPTTRLPRRRRKRSLRKRRRGIGRQFWNL